MNRMEKTDQDVGEKMKNSLRREKLKWAGGKRFWIFNF
jgi:hypothetical protein